MRFDLTKNAANEQKHGVSLTFGDCIFDDPDHLVLSTIREKDREERFKVIGLVEGKIYKGVFVWRDGHRRFISVRRSNKGEERSYRASC